MYQFSQAFRNPVGSPIRELFKYLNDPEMISFAAGYPDPQLCDVAGLRSASERAFAQPQRCLPYGGTDGIEAIKDQFVRLMGRRGVRAAPENIVVTTGSQQAFDVLLKVMIDPGDIALVESPTYPTNINALRVHGARLVPVPMDAEGLDVDALEGLLEAMGTAGETPKLLYTVPTFGNPTGALLSLPRRLRLLALAARFRFVIAEDDPYGDIRFDGDALPSLCALAPQVEGAEAWVVHMGSLSKIVAPGLRVGWSVAPREIASRCVVAKQTADMGSSPVTQSIAAEYLASGSLDAHLRRIRDSYAAKCDALCDSLRELMPDAMSFTRPAGGMFVWARLHGGVPASELLAKAIAHKVMFVPGAGFHPGAPDPSTLRLSFAAPSVDRIREGVCRLALAWKETGTPTPRALVATTLKH